MQATHGFAVLLRSRARSIGSAVAVALALALALASTASAAGAPIVETKPASGINQTEAQLNGQVNANGSAVTECKFEWGTTEAYGKTVPCSQGVPFNDNKGVNAKLKGLTAATTYHFRVSATNSSGTSKGGDQKFSTPGPPHKTYLALGDSVAFGYSQELFNLNFPKEEPKQFETAPPEYGSGVPNGYVLDYQNSLKASQTPASTWNPAVNNGCPGETTDGTIGSASLRKQMEGFGLPVTTAKGSWIESTVSTAPCPYKYATGFHLHHEYGDNHSQLENGLEVIRGDNKSANPDHPVATLTLNIGANDELRAVKKCEAEVKTEIETTGNSKYNKEPFVTPTEEAELAAAGPKEKDEAGVNHCIKAHVGEIFHHILNNIFSIGFALRHASMFCVNANAPCDPGHKGIDYKGKIVFLGGYDPFGSVFEESTPMTETMAEDNDELLPGSNFLAGILNIDEAELITEPSKGIVGCFANPQPTFDPIVIGLGSLEWGEGAPGSLISKLHGGKLTGANDRGQGATGGAEPDPSPFGSLQKYTNMVNLKTDRGLTYGSPEADGPDIHPTPLGYEELTKSITSQCPS